MASSGKVFFLMSRVEHPRMWRRVLRLQANCSDSWVAGFERIGSPVLHEHEFQSLGCISHRKFSKRIVVYLKAIKKCLAPVSQADVCYAFSLDLLLLLYFIRFFGRSRCKLAYEVADVHPLLYARGIRGELVRAVERFLVKRCSVVVLTSAAFKDGYFRELQKLSGFESVVIEHKVELPRGVRDSMSEERIDPSALVIGYMGLIKSVESFDLLLKLADKVGNAVKIKFWGRFVLPIVESEALQRIEALPNVEYMGVYRSPEDLKKVYSSVDMVWDAYRDDGNAFWQRTTRFSEACFFKRPVFYYPSTQDGVLASRHGIGVAIDFDKEESVYEAFAKIDDARLASMRRSMNALPDSLLYYGNEYEELGEKLGLAANGSSDDSEV